MKQGTVNNDINKGIQEAERKIPLNYASRYTNKSGGLQKSTYLPFKVCIPGSHFVLLRVVMFLSTFVVV